MNNNKLYVLRGRPEGCPFTASTLQIGGYHSYQHRKLQAAQVTISYVRCMARKLVRCRFKDNETSLSDEHSS